MARILLGSGGMNDHRTHQKRSFRRSMVRASARGCNLLLLSACCVLASACDRPREEQHLLEHVGPEAKVQKPRAHDAHQRFRRAHLELASTGGLGANAEIEEVMIGVRIEVTVDDAKPGDYAVVVHDQGTCTDGSSLGKPFVFSAEAAEQHPALGKIVVERDGQGEARWLTSRGSLKSDAPDSLLGKPLALYASYDPKLHRGDLLACGMILRERVLPAL